MLAHEFHYGQPSEPTAQPRGPEGVGLRTHTHTPPPDEPEDATSVLARVNSWSSSEKSTEGADAAAVAALTATAAALKAVEATAVQAAEAAAAAAAAVGIDECGRPAGLYGGLLWSIRSNAASESEDAASVLARVKRWEQSTQNAVTQAAAGPLGGGAARAAGAGAWMQWAEPREEAASVLARVEAMTQMTQMRAQAHAQTPLDTGSCTGARNLHVHVDLEEDAAEVLARVQRMQQVMMEQRPSPSPTHAHIHTHTHKPQTPARAHTHTPQTPAATADAGTKFS